MADLITGLADTDIATDWRHERASMADDDAPTTPTARTVPTTDGTDSDGDSSDSDADQTDS